MKPNEITKDSFEQREIAEERGYYKDPRWKEVHRLRKAKEHPKANGLVGLIRYDWGVD